MVASFVDPAAGREVLAITYSVVLATELVGDRSLYTIAALTGRLPARAVFLGISVAYLAKMFIAVLLGHAIAELPRWLIAAIGSATFGGTAFALWRRGRITDDVTTRAPLVTWPHATLTAFAAIFFTEWADAGQIAAASLAARYSAPMAVWLGASLALLTKGLLAMTLGAGLRRRVPALIMRRVAIGVCVTMGILAALNVD